MSAPVRRRLAIICPGFEPMPVAAHGRRFRREAETALACYGLSVRFGDPQERGGPFGSETTPATVEGSGGATETDVVHHDLGRFTAPYVADSAARRFLAGHVALADFLFAGAARRYAAVAWRYALFYAFPLFVLLAAGAAAALAGAATAFAGVPASVAAGATAAFAVLLAAQRRLHLLLALDSWRFARDLARRRVPDFDAVADAIADDCERRLRAGNYEEVVFASHSFGAISAVAALSRLSRRGVLPARAGLLTAGSSLFQIGLHPAARWLLADIDTAGRAVDWIDAQALVDPMNFHGSDPSRLMAPGAMPRLATISVRFRRQLSAATYRRAKRDFFRIHRQFVLAVEKPDRYSWHAILTGPEPFAVVRANGGLTWTGWEASRPAISSQPETN